MTHRLEWLDHGAGELWHHWVRLRTLTLMEDRGDMFQTTELPFIQETAFYITFRKGFSAEFSKLNNAKP